jgi:phospholipase C
VIAYDDSDGWYDHVYSGVLNPSSGPAEALTGSGECGTGTPLAGEQGRCGLGPRQPLLVISPWAKSNFVDHTQTDLSSIVKFVEDNWALPRIAGSFATNAGALDGMFDFKSAKPGNGAKFLLNPLSGQHS